VPDVPYRPNPPRVEGTFLAVGLRSGEGWQWTRESMAAGPPKVPVTIAGRTGHLLFGPLDVGASGGGVDEVGGTWTLVLDDPDPTATDLIVALTAAEPRS
jgi:hypothetical protein